MPIKGFSNAKILNITTTALFSTNFGDKAFEMLQMFTEGEQKVYPYMHEEEAFSFGQLCLGTCWILEAQAVLKILAILKFQKLASISRVRTYEPQD